MTPERTIQDVLDAINSFASDTERRFQKLEAEIREIKTTVVTKDHFDKRLDEFREELMLISRKTNTKLTVLIDSLVAEKSLDPIIARKILALEPFPQS